MSGEPIDHVGRAVACHVRWMRAIAEAGDHPVIEADGATFVLTSAPVRETMLALHGPSATVEAVTTFATWSDEVGADRSVAWANRLVPTTAAALAVHGFWWMGRPTWMRRSLTNANLAMDTDPVRLATPLDLTANTNDLLPCLHPATAELRRAMAKRWPMSIRHYISWVDGIPVGQASACLALDLRAMSVHDAYLLEEARPAGIGLDRVLNALDHHRREGIEEIYVAAEEEGRALYRMFGFAPVGTGQSWIRLPSMEPQARPDRHLTIALAIAADTPDSVAEAMGCDVRFANGMTALDLAAAIGCTEAARSWLDDHLADNLVAAWRLGRRDEVVALLHETSSLPGHPLHEAVVDNDRELLDLLIQAGFDPDRPNGEGLTAIELAANLRRYPLSTRLRRYRREREQT